MALQFDILDRTAATRAVDQTDEGQLQVARHDFGSHELVAHSAVIGPATHREVVRSQDYRARIDTRPPGKKVGRSEVHQLAVFIVFGRTSKVTYFVEGTGVHQFLDSLANRQPAARPVAGHLLFRS